MSEVLSTDGKQWFGHPRGLSTLFFTEMWERFSYYGMRGLLVLFMTLQIQQGGLGFTEELAAAIYGLYTMFVYLLALPGGWVADRILGQQRSVWYGGIVIASGHFAMAIPSTNTFFLGLVLIVVGTGMLKPNISTIVGDLYPEGGARRDSGFSVFYMGINLGAFIAPLACGFLAESSTFKAFLANNGFNPDDSWHWAFALAGIGMVMGLIQFRLTRHYLGESGLNPKSEDPPHVIRRNTVGALAGLGLIALIVALVWLGLLPIDPVIIANAAGVIILSIAVLYFAYVLLFGDLDEVERKRVVVIALLLLFASIFWSGFEQAGSSLNLFARDFTDRVLLGWEMPASWLQSVNSLFIITLAPAFAWLWLWLAARNLEPSSPVKFSLGLIFLGLGFLVIFAASLFVAQGSQVLPTWLITMYLLHTIGELCLSPIGLSLMTKLAPKKMVGQMMGMWFFATAFGNLIAGLVAGRFDSENVADIPDLFFMVTAITIGSGLVLLLFTKPIRKLMGGVH